MHKTSKKVSSLSLHKKNFVHDLWKRQPFLVVCSIREAAKKKKKVLLLMAGPLRPNSPSPPRA